MQNHVILLRECFPIRLPGSTIGGVSIDKDNVITRIQIDGNYYKDIYPKGINKVLDKYIGEKIYIKHG